MGGPMRLLLLCIWALVLGVAMVLSVACEPLPSVTAPSLVHEMNTPQGTTAVDICEAIRSGRIKPWQPVPGC